MLKERYVRNLFHNSCNIQKFNFFHINNIIKRYDIDLLSYFDKYNISYLKYIIF